MFKQGSGDVISCKGTKGTQLLEITRWDTEDNELKLNPARESVVA